MPYFAFVSTNASIVKKNDIFTRKVLMQIFLNVFTNRKKCDIIVMPNELNIRADSYIFFVG